MHDPAARYIFLQWRACNFQTSAMRYLRLIMGRCYLYDAIYPINEAKYILTVKIMLQYTKDSFQSVPLPPGNLLLLVFSHQQRYLPEIYNMTLIEWPHNV